MEFKIRQATLNDIDSIAELHQKLVYDQLLKDPYLNEDFNIPIVNKKSIELNLNDKNSVIFIATTNNKIIGFIEAYIQEKDYYFFMDDYAYIVNMYVEEIERSFHLLNELLTKIEEWAKEKGMAYVQFDVFEHNSNVCKIFNFFQYKSYRHRVVKKI